VLNGTAFTTAGNLSNTGILTVGSASTLNVHGTYVQGSAATLDVQLGGSPSGGQFGQLIAARAATLNGSLEAEVVASYQPTIGDQFTVLSYPSESGTFTTLNLPATPAFTFHASVNAANVVLNAQGTPTDLAVASIDSITPNSAVVGQNRSVTYTVTNHGAATPVSNWTDSVFLSATTTRTSAAVLLGRLPHSEGVGTGGHYQATLTEPLPGVLPGNDHVIVETDSQGVVPDVDRDNNVLASTALLPVDVRPLTISPTGGPAIPVSGTVAAGQDLFFRVDVPAGEDVQITLDTGVAGGAELAEQYQQLPTSNSFDQFAFDPTQALQTITLDGRHEGTYFISVADQWDQLDPFNHHHHLPSTPWPGESKRRRCRRRTR
jgi:hypothetical protein